VRIAVISDTHMPRGARRLPDACLRELDGAEVIFHAGDFTAREVLDELLKLAPVEAVHGNMDSPELRSLLPERRVLEIAGHRVGMTHDPGPRAGREARLAALFPGCELVIYGHTHLPELVRHGNVTFLNPGSPTERRRAPTHTMATIVAGEAGLDTNICSL
jgi:putative phosphoesterase